jgi:preprotein translocase subunit SecF
MTSSNNSLLREPAFRIHKHRRFCISLTVVLVIFSVLGIILSWLSPIHAPLKPGLDFTGGTAIQVERICKSSCTDFSIIDLRKQLPPGAVVQTLDAGKGVSVRSLALTPAESGELVEKIDKVVGPLQASATQINTIGPLLGSQLLRSSLLALIVSFIGVAIYISLRYARLYAAMALLCLSHDVLLTSGLFAWLGLLFGVEVDSLFAVALLTLAGYSINDTVVVFDRIREQQQVLPDLTVEDQVDRAVAGTIRRSIYTTVATELPILALILFGGETLYWFAVALFVGVAIGGWSSIGLIPPVLPLVGGKLPQKQSELSLSLSE